MCFCMCTMCGPLKDRMLPGDLTLLSGHATAIWICIPGEQEDSNMVMRTQWYAKNDVSNIFIYTYITGQPSDVEGSSIRRRGVEGLTISSCGIGTVKSYRKAVKRHADKFCPRALVGGAGSDTRRPRRPLRPRGCGCTGGSSELCEGRIDFHPAPRRRRQHMTLKKHLVAAAAIPAASSLVSSI